VAQTPPNASRIPHPSSSDALIAVLLFAGLAALFALTRSHWLDDWDSVNFAFALDDFDVMRHRPHPPGITASPFSSSANAPGTRVETGEPDT
jgi:hypothetical protein